MLKRISVSQLTLGMHVKEFCGSWMEHPFWRTAFVLTDPKDIEVVLASSITEVWIDCGMWRWESLLFPRLSQKPRSRLS